jgi:hypothetical protein
MKPNLALIRPHEQASLNVCGIPHAALCVLNNVGVPYWSEDRNYHGGRFRPRATGQSQGIVASGSQATSARKVGRMYI